MVDDLVLKLYKTQFFLVTVAVCAFLLGWALVEAQAGPHAAPYGQNACAEFVISSDPLDTDVVLGTTFSVTAGYQSVSLHSAGAALEPTVKPASMDPFITTQLVPFSERRTGWSWEKNPPLATQVTTFAFDWSILYSDDYNGGTPVATNMHNFWMATSTCADWGGNTFGASYVGQSQISAPNNNNTGGINTPYLATASGTAILDVPPDGCFGIIWVSQDWAQHYGLEVWSMSLHARQISTEEFPCR